MHARPVLVAVLTLCVLVLQVVGCTAGQGGWDEDALGRRYPAVEDHRGQRLGDARPYFAPAQKGLVLFLCHWPPNRAIPVSLPADAGPDERRILVRVLEAWERAIPAVRFTHVQRSQARLRIEFVASDEADKPRGSANTAADCRVDLPEGGFSDGLTRVEASLTHASVHLRRENIDQLGRAVALREDQLIGTALHEIGHALGYPSHAIVGNTLMGRSVDHVRREGKRVASGARLEAPSVAALYEVPSGVVVGRVPLSSDGRRRFRALEQLARSRQWRGPEVRVGDRSSRFWWWDEQGRPVGFLLTGSIAGLDPSSRLLPTSAARELGLWWSESHPPDG